MTNLVNVGKVLVAATVAIIASELAAGQSISNIENGKELYHYATDTVEVKKHPWSKPQTVYKRNGKPVTKKK